MVLLDFAEIALLAGIALTALVFCCGARRWLGRVPAFFCLGFSLLLLFRAGWNVWKFYGEDMLDCTGLARQSLIFNLVAASVVAGSSQIGFWLALCRPPKRAEEGTGLSAGA